MLSSSRNNPIIIDENEDGWYNFSLIIDIYCYCLKKDRR